MSHQTWLADRARDWGLTVVECDGWQTRGSSSFTPGGVVAHHTAGPAGGGDIPSLPTLINGRPDLAGPLCNYGLGRSGTVYVVAAGRANHAGSGGWNGLSGNSSVVGIEAENDGFQPWPAEQLDAYGLLGAAICDELYLSPEMVCRHHEWRSEKPDPHDLDGDAGRERVAQLLISGPGGPDMANAPAVIFDSLGRKVTLIRGRDAALWWNTGTAPNGWKSLGGEIDSAPAVAKDDDGNLLVAAIGADGQVFHRTYSAESASWGGWLGIGGGV